MKKSKRLPRERLIEPVIPDEEEMTPEEIEAAVKGLAPLMEKANAKSSSPPASFGKSPFDTALEGLFTRDELETIRALGLL